MPRGAHPLIWRVVLDPRIPDGLADVRARWTFQDLVHAHLLLDQLDVQEARRQTERERAHG